MFSNTSVIFDEKVYLNLILLCNAMNFIFVAHLEDMVI